MARARTTEEDVYDILESPAVGVDDITPFLIPANLFVTTRLGAQGLAADLLAEIERWVCAHFVAASKEKSVRSETIGKVTQEYQLGRADVGLGTTEYGQRAMLLDPTGLLADAALRPISVGVVDYGPAHDPDA